MNDETYEALKQVIEYAHKELNKIKRVSNKYHTLVALSTLEKFIFNLEKHSQENQNAISFISELLDGEYNASEDEDYHQDINNAIRFLDLV